MARFHVQRWSPLRPVFSCFTRMPVVNDISLSLIFTQPLPYTNNPSVRPFNVIGLASNSPLRVVPAVWDTKGQLDKYNRRFPPPHAPHFSSWHGYRLVKNPLTSHHFQCSRRLDSASSQYDHSGLRCVYYLSRADHPRNSPLKRIEGSDHERKRVDLSPLLESCHGSKLIKTSLWSWIVALVRPTERIHNPLRVLAWTPSLFATLNALDSPSSRSLTAPVTLGQLARSFPIPFSSSYGNPIQ